MRPIALLGIAAVLLVGGCGSESQPSAPTTAKPTAIPSAVMSSIQADAGIPPKPDPRTQAAFIQALEAIDPDIVHGKEDKAVDRARNQCSSIKEHPDDRDRLVQLTNMRFTSPDHPDGFGKAKSAKILAAVRTYICPAY
ncbi:hypothetical protein ACWEQG_01780 [Microbispora sp. NPDC004025]